MAQHDTVIDNGPGITVRTDINAALAAIFSSNSGPVAPTVTYAGMLWLDTSTSGQTKLKVLDINDNAWVDLATGSSALPISGGTMTGPLVLYDNPAAALEAAPKQYVDNIAAGLDVKPSVKCATIANLA